MVSQDRKQAQHKRGFWYPCALGHHFTPEKRTSQYETTNMSRAGSHRTRAHTIGSNDQKKKMQNVPASTNDGQEETRSSTEDSVEPRVQVVQDVAVIVVRRVDVAQSCRHGHGDGSLLLRTKTGRTKNEGDSGSRARSRTTEDTRTTTTRNREQLLFGKHCCEKERKKKKETTTTHTTNKRSDRARNTRKQKTKKKKRERGRGHIKRALERSPFMRRLCEGFGE